MFDIAPTELLVCAIVALVVIGPKDLPKALRVVGNWVAKIRGYARHFRSGVDAMIRESELADLEKQWAEQNAKIMAEYPTTPAMVEDVAPSVVETAVVETAPAMEPLFAPPSEAAPVPEGKPSKAKVAKPRASRAQPSKSKPKTGSAKL
jgi:sec-independent protein translocase protein TatB